LALQAKGTLTRPRSRREDNNKMNFQEVEWGQGMDWIGLAQARNRWPALINVVMNLWVP
jgi:hypothetical protein